MGKKPLKFIAIVLSCLLIFQQTGFAQVATVELNVASRFPTLTSTLSPDKFRPLHLRSLAYDELNNNFKLLLDKGDNRNPKTQEIESAAKDLLNYFLVGIALPNDSFWVNLRPDSPNDIIDPLLAQTEVGKILLEADLQLKKDTAQATNPGTPEGREYWDKLYRKAGEIYGTQNVTIPALTRPWIVPDEIIVRESVDSAYVYKATLKVMLEQDYLKGSATYSFKDEREKQLNDYSSQIIREEIIPKLTKEINNAKRYAPLRQVYYSLILAQWFKARNQNKNTQYSRQINRKDLTNLRSQAPYSVDSYFSAYKDNFAKGEYNIKGTVSTPYGQVIRSYFSGGIVMAPNNTPLAQALALPMGSVAGNIPGSQPESGSRDNLSVIVDGQTVQVMSAEPGRLSQSGQQTTIPDPNTFPVKAQEKVRSTLDEYKLKMRSAQANINALLIPLESDPKPTRDKVGHAINQADRELGQLYFNFESRTDTFNKLYLSYAWVNSELVAYRLEVRALRQEIQERLLAIIAKNNLAQESSGIVGQTVEDWVRSFSTGSVAETRKLYEDQLAQVNSVSGEFGSGVDILTHATPVENLPQLLQDAQLLSVAEYEKLHGSLPGRAQGKEGSADVENKQVVFDENVINAKYSRSFNLELPYVALAFSARSLITQNQFTVDDGIHIFPKGNVLESTAGLAINLAQEPFVLVTNKKFEAVIMAQLRALAAKPNKLGLNNDNIESWVQSHLYLVSEADASYIRFTPDLQSMLYNQFDAQDAAGRTRPVTGTFVPTGEIGHGVNNKLLNLYTFNGSGSAQQSKKASSSAGNQDVRQDLKNQAEQALGRPVSEEELDAIQRAHEVGPGHFLGKQNADGTYEKNEDPNLAYTPEEIAQKARILKNAGFTNEQIRKLMKFGITGNKDPGKQRDQTPAQKSGLEYAENILSDLSKSSFTFVTTDLTNALNQLSIGDLLHIFVRLLKNEYSLNKTKSALYLGSSQWDQIIFLIKGRIGVDIEAVPYIISLFKNPDISVNEQVHLWEILMNLSQISAEEVIRALNAAGIAPETLAEMAMASGEVNKKSNAAVRSILQTLLSQDKVSLETQQYYAKLILMIVERNLRRNRVFDVVLAEKALDVLEPVTTLEQSQANQTAYADLKARYVAQVLIINEIFQQAMKIIYEDPDISYAELCDKLLVKGPAGEKFLRLTRNQRVAIRFALIRNRVDRLVLKQKFEEARGKYPIDAFNNVSQGLMDLYQQRKVYARARNYAAIREINRRINSLRQKLADLRRSVAPYLETECGIAAKDAPEVAIISLGPLGLEIHVDSQSLQKAIYSKLESKDGPKDNDPILEMMRHVLGRANSRVDINSLRDALRRFPFYLYQDFQNEMVAYMTNAELRSRNFNNLLDEYFQLYLYRIFEYIKNQEWFKKVGMTEGELKSYLEARMLSPEWQQVKARLKTAKQLLDNLIDLKATLIYHEMLAQGAVNSQELKDRAYKEASIYVMGIFQLVPILKLDRITAILDLFMAELEAKGISRNNILRIFTAASNEAERRDIEKQQLWAGMARGNVVWTVFRGGDRVIDHERQHVIFGQYTGAVAMKYTPGNDDFHRLLSDAVRGKPEFANEQPLADLSYLKISLSDQTSGSSMGAEEVNQDVRQDLKNQAEQALERPVTEAELDAIQQAHEVGPGHFLGKQNADGTYEKNEDPNLAYAPEEIAQKARILKNAGFTNEQVRKLMKFGITGNKDPGKQRDQVQSPLATTSTAPVTLEMINDDVVILESTLDAAALKRIPRLGFHIEKLGHQPEGNFWYYIFDLDSEYYAGMGTAEFLERLQGAVIRMLNFFPQGTLPEIYILKDSEKRALFVTDTKPRNDKVTSSYPLGNRASHRYFFTEGKSSSFEVLSALIVRPTINLTPQEYADAQNWGSHQASVQALKDPDNLLAKAYLSRLLYKKTLEVVLALSEVDAAAAAKRPVTDIGLRNDLATFNLTKDGLSIQGSGNVIIEGAACSVNLWGALQVFSQLPELGQKSGYVTRVTISDADNVRIGYIDIEFTRGDASLEKTIEQLGAMQNKNIFVSGDVKVNAAYREKGIATAFMEYSEKLAAQLLTEIRKYPDMYPSDIRMFRLVLDGDSTNEFTSKYAESHGYQILDPGMKYLKEIQEGQAAQGEARKNGGKQPPAEVSGKDKIQTPGGIDFRYLPIVTQSMDNLKASIKSTPASSLQRTNLTKEWSDIGRLINSGITLSAERLKEYFAASCYKDNLNNDADKIVSCIADILRAQEESCSLTDPALKDILIVLGSGRRQEELKLALAN